MCCFVIISLRLILFHLVAHISYFFLFHQHLYMCSMTLSFPSLRMYMNFSTSSRFGKLSSESGIHLPLGYVPCTENKFSGPDAILQSVLLQFIVGEILVSAEQTMLGVPFPYGSLDTVLVHMCF